MRKFEDKYLITHNFNFNPNEIVVTPEIIKGSIVHMYDTLDMICLLYTSPSPRDCS